MVPVFVKCRTDYYELGEFSSRSPISRKLLQDKEPGVIFIVVKKCCPAFILQSYNIFRTYPNNLGPKKSSRSFTGTDKGKKAKD